MKPPAARLEVVGVGRPGDRSPSSTSRRWRCCASELGELRAGSRPAQLGRGSSCPPRAASREPIAAAVGEERPRRRPRTGSATRPARATRTWPGCAPAGSSTAPDAVVLPADADAGAPRARGLRGRRGRGGPVRRRHQRRRRGRAAARRATRRLISLDLARLRRSSVDRALADGAARRRPARPRGRGGAGRARADPRPLPAVLRVRDDRRLRGDPLGRPGLERLRALRRARHRGRADRAGRRAADAGDARTPPPGPRCAS